MSEHIKEHLKNAFLLVIIAFIISIILVALAVGKTEMVDKEEKKETELFAPIQQGL